METRKGNILRNAAEIFHRYGIRSISMDDLSRRLGISKKTLYTFVRNKEDLVEKALEFQHKEAEEEIKLMRLVGGNAIDFLLSLSKQVCHRLIDFNPVMVYDLRKYHPQLLDKMIAFHHDYYARLFTTNLEEGIREGLYRPDIDKDLTIKSYLLNMEKFFGEEIANGNTQNLSQILRVIFGNHIRAIASADGLRYFTGKEQLLDYHIESE